MKILMASDPQNNPENASFEQAKLIRNQQANCVRIAISITFRQNS
jgi:hypothetical protein